MPRLNYILLLMILMAAGLSAPNRIIAQPAPPDGRGGPGPGGRGGPDGRGPPPPPEQRLAAQIQSLLGSNAQEWELLQPKIEHIQLLLKQREHVTHPHGPKPPPPPPPADDPNGPPPPPPPELSPEMAAASTLTDVGPEPGKDVQEGSINADLMQAYLHMTVLAASAPANPVELRSAIETFHAALMKSNLELADARKELRQLVTVQQEAVLIVTGILD